MPELPEVEIASRQLRSWALGRRVTAVHAVPTRVIRGQTPEAFAPLTGRTLVGIERRGKWMLLLFDRGLGLISHLGMTGKWLRRERTEPAPKHTRASLELSDKSVLDYTDPRLFGRLIAGSVEQLRAHPSLAALGPDPLGGVDGARLYGSLQRTSRSIKEALMDQGTLAGLGNIHVGESLHRAALHPERPADSLSREEAALLARRIEESIRFALEAQDGPEPIQYVEEGGENPFLVYGRAGEPCPGCGSEIERIVQGGRSTFFCANCQPRSAGRPKNREASRQPARPRAAKQAKAAPAKKPARRAPPKPARAKAAKAKPVRAKRAAKKQ
jgi:formamidopyrimidine-DNA glycosylase